MAISNFDELKQQIRTYPDRENLEEDDIENMILLAEARLNRLISLVETEAVLTGSIGSRVISLSTLSVVEPIALKLIQSTDGDERDIILSPYGTIDYLDDTGEPDFAEISGTNLKFDRKLDEAYSFRFVYKGRFALSDDAPTNKLLTENPDVYLSAAIVWGGIFTQDEVSASLKGLLDEFVRETRIQLAQAKRTQLVPAPMISALGRRRAGSYDGNG